ncbi:hypothetical protein H8356DRAFT_1432909 [Neocallimastix lanati (nom. inval.)]|nr:hypothetical protein H8356DRAFT_1432909 [Neocallimastix sp. JGI-2020a]
MLHKKINNNNNNNNRFNYTSIAHYNGISRFREADSDNYSEDKNEDIKNNSELDNKSQNNSNNHTTKSSKNHIPKRREKKIKNNNESLIKQQSIKKRKSQTSTNFNYNYHKRKIINDNEISIIDQLTKKTIYHIRKTIEAFLAVENNSLIEPNNYKEIYKIIFSVLT